MTLIETKKKKKRKWRKTSRCLIPGLNLYNEAILRELEVLPEFIIGDRNIRLTLDDQMTQSRE